MSTKVFRVVMGLFVLLIALTIIGVVWFLSLLTARSEESQENCSIYLSTPVSTEITADLCQRDLVPTSLGNCTSPNFQIQIKDVEEIIRANVQVGSTKYQDVDNMFNEYTTYCEERNSTSEYRCIYDISRRGPRVSIYYDPTTDAAVSIRVPSCSGS